ncbi:MAG: hypothetical protein WC101_04880 [Candidatus Gracilibacteria bacterium]
MSNLKNPTPSPTEIFEAYEYNARQVHKESADKERIKALVYKLHEIIDLPTDRGGNRQILNEIDILLWQGKTTLRQLGITMEQWVETCVMCKFYSAYMRHAVPEAFELPREFHDEQRMDTHRKYRLLLTGENYMDREVYIPRRKMAGYLLPPKGLPMRVDEADMPMFGQATTQAVHFLQELTASAALIAAEFEMQSGDHNPLVN